MQNLSDKRETQPFHCMSIWFKIAMINALFYHGLFKWIRKKENKYLTFITNKFSLIILIKKIAFVPVKIDVVFELRLFSLTRI